MKYVKMKCDSCGANLKVNARKGYAYCEHCGNKVYADWSDDLLIEKERTKQKRYEYKKQKELNYRYEYDDYDDRHNSNVKSGCLKIIKTILIAIVIIITLIILMILEKAGII